MSNVVKYQIWWPFLFKTTKAKEGKQNGCRVGGLVNIYFYMVMYYNSYYLLILLINSKAVYKGPTLRAAGQRMHAKALLERLGGMREDSVPEDSFETFRPSIPQRWSFHIQNPAIHTGFGTSLGCSSCLLTRQPPPS